MSYVKQAKVIKHSIRQASIHVPRQLTSFLHFYICRLAGYLVPTSKRVGD